ncbi:NAD(P)/FAD-dependent oxidoreductase [Actinoplanes sp. NPDC051633]|uniref:FAD-dependent oxidoreductase n=1 Tax=Actinoplanes sp. NPDC051633 TaxID=3155670 RepID=UPI003430DB7D
MRVVIVGAGIGGLALACGLTRDGHQVRVLEKADGLRLDGAAVTIFSNGAAAADGLGVPLDGLGGRVETLSFGTPDGREFARADLRELHRRTGYAVATVPRRAILERFADALPAGTIAFGREVTDVETPAADAPAADVVVGADGHRSAVRRAVLGDEPAAPNGWTSWQGLTKDVADLGTHARCLIGPQGLCGLMPAGDGLLQWWFDVGTDRPEAGGTVGWLRDRFRGYADPVPDLLDHLTEADVQEYRHVTHRVLDRWGTGSTTLLGDAAHAFPPSQAQGANQALEDAWLLRRALAAGPGNLRSYERIRARRVRRISRLATSEVTNRPPSTAARLAGRLLTPRLLARLQLAAIRRASSVLNDDRPE